MGGDDADVTNLVCILVAGRGEGLLQTIGQFPQAAVIRFIVVVAGILVGDGDLHAMIFAHVQAGQGPVFRIGVDGRWRAGDPILDEQTPGRSALLRGKRSIPVLGGWRTGIGHRLHQPDHAHFVGFSPGADIVGPIDHAGREGHLAAAGLVSRQVEGNISDHIALVIGVTHGDTVRFQFGHVDHLVGVRAVGDVAQVGADSIVPLAQHHGMTAIQQAGQLFAGDGASFTVSDISVRLHPRIACCRTGAGIDLGREAAGGTFKLKLDFRIIALLRVLQRGADPASGSIPALDLASGLRGGQRQGGNLATAGRNLDLQHGHQAHIAVPIGIIAGRWGVHLTGKRVVFDPLDLALPVAARPIEYVHGVGQVVRIARSNLKVYEDGVALVPCLRLQIVHHQLERSGVAEARHRFVRRSVHAVGDAIVVVVSVKEVRCAVIVGVQVASGVGHTTRDRSPAFHRVQQAIVVAIRAGGVAVPMLAAQVEPFHLQVVAQLVVVAVGFVGVGAQQHLLGIGQAVVVGVGGGVGRLGIADCGLRIVNCQ